MRVLLLLGACVVVISLDANISFVRLADYVKERYQSVCRTCSAQLIQPIPSLIFGVVDAVYSDCCFFNQIPYLNMESVLLIFLVEFFQLLIFLNAFTARKEMDHLAL